VIGKVMVGLLKVLGRLQQCFGRNATDVGTCATKGWGSGCVFPFINAGYLETQLGRSYGSNITTGAATNDDHIKLFAHANVSLDVKQQA
jgi:hypothetical protein